MKFRHLLALIIISLFISSFSLRRTFPSFEYLTISGQVINNEILLKRKSLVIIGHIGCPATMYLFKDLESVKKDSIQVIIFLENTKDQVLLFNSDSSNNWSAIRKHFNLKPLSGNTVAECEQANVEENDGDLIIRQQCRRMSKKLFTNTSPATFLINEKGKIVYRRTGYYTGGTVSSRLNNLFK